MDKPRRPAELIDKHARRYWDTHAPTLWADGTLTGRDVESFTVLCQVYGRLQQLTALPVDPENYRAAVQHNNMLKMYQQYAARFGLIGPKGRPPEKTKSITDVLNDVMGVTSPNIPAGDPTTTTNKKDNR